MTGSRLEMQPRSVAEKPLSADSHAAVRRGLGVLALAGGEARPDLPIGAGILLIRISCADCLVDCQTIGSKCACDRCMSALTTSNLNQLVRDSALCYYHVVMKNDVPEH